MKEENEILENCTFTFSQDGNCLTGQDNSEQIDIEFNSSLGLDRDVEGFFMIKTDGWSVNGSEDIEKLFNRIRLILNTKKT